MKAASRPQYYRIKRIVDMVREGSAEGYLPSRSDFRRELEVSPRTLARDLDFLRDEERAPIEYDARAHGYRLTDETYRLPPVRLSRKEAFSWPANSYPVSDARAEGAGALVASLKSW